MPMFILLSIVLLAVRYEYRRIPASTQIVDGDSLRVRGWDWRLSGYDAPEWNQPGGPAAKAFLTAILRDERCIALLRGVDHYDRRVATVLTPRGPLSWRMALAGHAHGEGLVAGTLTYVARLLRRGLWAKRGVVTPRAWRGGLR